MRSTCPRLIVLVLAAVDICVGVCFGSGAAVASPAESLQSARRLFADAELDEDAGRWNDALEKLRRVRQFKDTAGVRYHVALCEEHLGHLALALADYTAADTQAHVEVALDVLKLVGKRLADLDLRVPRLTVRLAPGSPEAKVWLDGSALRPDQVGTAIPVDPGAHHVEATADDWSPFREDVTVDEGDRTVVDMALVKSVVPLATTPSPAPARSTLVPNGGHTSGRPRGVTVAYGALALALAAGGVGAYLAAGAAHANGVTSCARVTTFDSGACSAEKRAVRAWDWVAAGAWAGAATASALAILSATKSPEEPPAGRVQLAVGVGSLAVQGQF